MKPPRFDEQFIGTVLAQALGTLLAALVILIVGLAAGVVSHVDARTWLSIGGALFGMVSAGAYLFSETKAREKAEQGEIRELLDVMTPDEHALMAKYLDKAQWNNMDGV